MVGGPNQINVVTNAYDVHFPPFISLSEVYLTLKGILLQHCIEMFIRLKPVKIIA